MNNQSVLPDYCKSFPGHPEDCEAINIVRRVFGAISCLSCIFVIFIIWAFGRHRLLSQRLLLYLTVAVLLNAGGRIFQDSTGVSGAWCTFQAFWLTFCNYAVMVWVCCITFNLFINVIKDVTTTVFYERCYHGVTWGLSLIMAVIPLAAGQYGPSGAWCWIVNDSSWQMGIWYVPLLVVMVILVVVYTYIVISLHRQASRWVGTYDSDTQRHQEALKNDVKPLKLVPFVFILMSVFPLVNRIHNAFDENHIFALVLLHSISASLQGAAYSLIFAIDMETLRSLTLTNIKMAIMKKYATPITVNEYPIGVAEDVPEANQRDIMVHNEATPADSTNERQDTEQADDDRADLTNHI